MNIDIDFDSAVYSVEAVMDAAYWCADRLSTDIMKRDSGISVALTPRAGYTLDQKSIEDFKMMVLHYQIRRQLQDKFADLERVIITKAFAPVSK